LFYLLQGAGKTTAISILTGLIPPTHGECTIYGESVFTELDEARQSMGICPQHDVLFRDLTVAEHLKLFDRIKGVSVTTDSMQKRAEDFGLGGVIHALPCQLSGGMKRKLSIAIAFCGDSKFILLDEPTTG
jgi:ATP-binding cassette subfamily A (ABC1) protein 3